MLNARGTGRAEKTMAIPLQMELPEAKLVEALRSLPLKRRMELLDTLRGLNEPTLRTNAPSVLHGLKALVALGGDAFIDAETICDDDRRHCFQRLGRPA